MSYFLTTLRSDNALDEQIALYAFSNKTLILGQITFEELAKTHCSEDGMIHLTLTDISTFGF